MQNKVRVVAEGSLLLLWRSNVFHFFGAGTFVVLVAQYFAEGAAFSQNTSFALSFLNLLMLYVASNIVSEQHAQRTLPMVMTRPVEIWAFLTGTCCGLIVAYALMAVFLCLAFAAMGVVRNDGTPAAHLLLWGSSVLAGIASCISGCAVGALMPRAWAINVLILGGLVLAGLQMLFLDDPFWLRNVLGQVAFYISPLSAPPTELLQLQQGGEIARSRMAWIIAAGLDSICLSMVLLYGASWVFNKARVP